MKMEGIKLGIPSTQLIVFPRVDPETGEEFQIPFECRAVLDYKDFERLVPEPKPPVKTFPSGEKVDDVEDKGYLKAQEDRFKKRMSYMLLKSLEVNENLSWEKVKMGDPSTWDLWKEEMIEAGFSEIETGRIQVAVAQVNSLDETTLEDAKANFLLHREGKKES